MLERQATARAGGGCTFPPIAMRLRWMRHRVFVVVLSGLNERLWWLLDVVEEDLGGGFGLSWGGGQDEFFLVGQEDSGLGSWGAGDLGDALDGVGVGDVVDADVALSAGNVEAVGSGVEED